MQYIGSPEKKIRTRVFDSGPFQGCTDYMIESAPGTRPAPQAFLVHQKPGWTLPTHFHLEDQFQVVVGGSGTLGRHAMTPVSIHFTSREAGYGPLVAGPGGLDYLTLRAVTDPGAWYLPEQRDKMRRDLRKRQESIGPVVVSSAQALACRRASDIEVLIRPELGGLAAWVMRLAAGGTLTAPRHGGGGGRFHVVIGGLLLHLGQTLPASSTIYASADEPPLSLNAGPQGVELLVLQYPGTALDSGPPVTADRASTG